MAVTLIKDIANIIQLVMWFYAYKRCLTRRYSLAVTWLLEAVIALVYYFGTHLLPDLTVLKTFLGILPLLLPIFLYTDKLWKRLALVSLELCAMFLVELACFSIFLRGYPAGTLPEDLAPSYQLIVYTTYLSMTGVVLTVIIALMTNSKTGIGGLPTSGALVFSLFPFSQYFLLALGTDTFKEALPSTVVLIMLSITACVIVDIAMYRVMIRLVSSAKLEAENRMLAEQVNAQNEYYTALTEQYERVGKLRHDISNHLYTVQVNAQNEYYTALTEQYERVGKLRHDISNHLYTVQVLLDDGRTEEAREYAADVQSKNEFNSSLGHCRNPVLDVFLFRRIEALKQEGIDVKADIRLPKEMGIKNSDLISLFGNLLDNAEDACLNAEPKYITLSAAVKNGYLIVSSENGYSEKARGEKARRIPELARGLGAHILSDLANTYDGEYKTSADGGIYRASVLLKSDLPC